MTDINSIRSHNLSIRLRDDEYARLDAIAKRVGVPHTTVLRQACPGVFVETEVKKGRRAGISPWKAERQTT